MKRIIHQIFWSFKENQTIEDIPIFHINTQFTKIICDQHNIEYKLWNKEDCDNLIKSDFHTFQKLWDDFFEPILSDFITLSNIKCPVVWKTNLPLHSP